MWQPIETAPRDGTELLICELYDDGSSVTAVVHWDENEWRGYGHPFAFDEATHWMPMPESPRG